jgi:hypothetical protein
MQSVDPTEPADAGEVLTRLLDIQVVEAPLTGWGSFGVDDSASVEAPRGFGRAGDLKRERGQGVRLHVWILGNYDLDLM